MKLMGCSEHLAQPADGYTNVELYCTMQSTTKGKTDYVDVTFKVIQHDSRFIPIEKNASCPAENGQDQRAKGPWCEFKPPVNEIHPIKFDPTKIPAPAPIDSARAAINDDFPIGKPVKNRCHSDRETVTGCSYAGE